MTGILNLYMKEWERNGGLKRSIQFILMLVFPLFLFFLLVLLPSMLIESRVRPAVTAGFIIFLINAGYSLIYMLQSEEKVYSGFPLEYMPVKSSMVSFGYIIFNFLFSSVMIYITFFAAVLIFRQFTVGTYRVFETGRVLQYLSPLFAGLPYMILGGVATGSLLGIIGRKMLDNVSQSTRKFIFILYVILVFSLLKPYFSKIWDLIFTGRLTDSLFVYSPIYWSSIISIMMVKKISILSMILSIAFTAVILALFAYISDRKLMASSSLDISISYSRGSSSFLSPLWNLVVSKWMTPPVFIFLAVWIGAMFIEYFTGNGLANAVSGWGFYIYSFIAIDRMFPSAKENYRYIWESAPVSRKHIEGVFLGGFYILYMIPVYMYLILNWDMLSQVFSWGIFPQTLSGMICTVYPFLSITVIIPILIMIFPYLWSVNDKGKKINKRAVMGYTVGCYILFGSASMLSAVYFKTPDFRMFVNNFFWGQGYFIAKTLMYALTLSFLFVHARSLFMVIRSFIYRT